ncbi:conserved Plasmodium protein, unknown function [Plasmodium gallinaceum]|uniref:Uncharacterized protein n=1 Tax=Plasmodium gallinaceum TaxID=5849 RepID=A0A1J1GWI8_PLAGA|nr:conserved Plasmodium protein, unknown function [Plasmodium gallinaceum]CRG96913.1 conserved Plasmodium protein, unknown function [Plasmodium gallinaceum]
MSIYYDSHIKKKDNNLNKCSCIEEEEEKEDNYVFIDEKYKEYFDSMSDLFEDKVEYILRKHFKKNDPTNKNKLLCLNVCVLWQKKFLLLLSKTLNEYEEYKKLNNLENEKDEKGIEKESNGRNNALEEEKNDENNKICIEKDLKSFIKNVKIVDNKNIEVIYDSNDLNDDNRPSAELSTDEIYYLLVESKKSENEYKKKIFTFLKYLPLFIKSIENKSLIEKKILEEKLLLNNLHNKNNQNELLNVNDLNENDNGNISTIEIKHKLDAIVDFNYNLSENLETLFKNGIGNMQAKNLNIFSNDSIQIMNQEENRNIENFNNNQINNDHYHHLNNINNLYLSKKDTNKKNNKSFIMPLSKINDLTLINNISTKSNNCTNEETNENETSFYIYKNNMDKMNLYGLDLLINLNNNLIYKINHIYSLIQFYTMLAKDIFNET